MNAVSNVSLTRRPEELAASRLFWLIGVFVAGLLLVVGLKAFFSHLHDDLGLRSANERARLHIGEEIVRGIQEIEKDAYFMTTLVGEAAQARTQEEIRQHVAKLNHDLRVLKDGGTVLREIELNIEGHDQMVREVHYRPTQEAPGLVMELIEIAPLLDQAEAKVADLRELLGQRMVLRERKDSAGYFKLEQRITLYLKHLPPYFLRLKENANRLFYESSQRLEELEQRLTEEQRHYQMLENLLVLLVIVVVTVAGGLFARDIRAANQRLHLAWEEMRAAKEEAERASRAKSDFVSRMSHELRTPMNAILGFAQLLDSEALDAEQRDFVREINRAGEHLLELINQVLDLAKIEAGGMTLENIPFDLMKTVDEVATLVADRARNQGLYLRFFASPDLPSRVMGDPTRLRQVLINLIGNAVKFTHQGGIDLRIQPVEEGARIEFSVHDTGIGMDAATLTRLFKPFSQADESTTRKYGGTGLGLMISLDLVRAMGGDIEVESQPGAGSLFRFSLPARPAEEAPARPVPLAGYRAMMTCSEPHQVEVLQAHLAALGAEVLAACGMEAVSQAIEAEPGRPWVFIGKKGCLANLSALSNLWTPDRRDIRLLLPENGEPTASPADVDAVLAEPFTYSRLLEIITQVQQDKTSRINEHAPIYQSPRPRHVLLVEDNRINQVVASRMLARLEVTVDLAQDGREALEKLQTGAYDLVLMDMQMPEMDGVEATLALRAWEKASGRPPIPVIAMTANALNEDRDLCLSSGMNDHLAKPVEAGRLAQVLERWGGR